MLEQTAKLIHDGYALGFMKNILYCTVFALSWIGLSRADPGLPLGLSDVPEPTALVTAVTGLLLLYFWRRS